MKEVIAGSCCQTHLEADEEEDAEDWKGLMQHALLERQVKSREFHHLLEEMMNHFAAI